MHVCIINFAKPSSVRKIEIVLYQSAPILYWIVCKVLEYKVW